MTMRQVLFIYSDGVAEADGGGWMGRSKAVENYEENVGILLMGMLINTLYGGGYFKILCRS